MPQYTFEGPDGQRHTIEGPEGSTPGEAFKILQQHLQPAGGPNSTPGSQRSTPGLLKSAASGLIQGAGAPGDFSSNALSNPPPQQPVDRDTYYGKLVDALNAARKHLELPTTPQVGNAVGMQPTQPVTTPEKIVQGGASMIPVAAMGGAPGARAAMGAAPAANAVRGMGMSPQGPASSVAGGAAGAAASPGNALQSQLLQAALQHGAGAAGSAIGGPVLGGLASKFAPHVLRLMKP